MKPKTPFWIISAVAILIYAHSLNNQFVIDDLSQIQYNPVIHSLSNIPSLFTGSSFADSNNLTGIYYKPVMTSFYTVIYSLSGNNPFPFHLIQLIFHISNAILVYLLFKKFFKQNLSLLLSLIFLVHPINTEAVVYISAFQDVLFFFFGMLALLVITKDKLSLLHFTLYTFFISLSLLSKETGILFLIITPLLSSLHPTLSFPRKWESTKIFTLSLLIGSIYLFIHHQTVGFTLKAKDSFPIMGASITERLISMPKIAFYYLKTFLFPVILPGDQGWVIRNLNWENFYLPLLFDLIFLTIFLVVFIYFWKKKDKLLKPFIFFALFFSVGLGFHLQLIPLDGTVADRWFYFPIVGLLGMLGITLAKPKNITVIIFIMIITIILFSIRTFARTLNWRDGLTLAQHDILYNLDNYALENNLGNELIKAGRFEEALPHIQKSIQLNSHWEVSWDNQGIIYRHIGSTKNDLSFIKMAEDSFTKSINLSSSYTPTEDLVETLFNFEGPQTAKQFLEDFQKVEPLSGPMYYWLAISNYQLDDKVGAFEAAKKAVDKDPNNQVYLNIHQALLSNQPIKWVKPKY